MTITKGNYTATIRSNGEGSFFTLVTYEGRCVPGIPGKHYASMKNAERGAREMLAKV